MHKQLNFKIIDKYLDVDECLDQSCHPDAACVDRIGSYDCNCNDGFVRDGYIHCRKEGNLYKEFIHTIIQNF